MKKVLLFMTTIALVFTLSSCGNEVNQHQRTLGSYDNYVQILNTTYVVSGTTTSNQTYYYVDNIVDGICITNFDPINLLDKDASGETPFGCLGMQLTINNEEYYYDGNKAYLFPQDTNLLLEDVFTSYFDLDDYEEKNGLKHYSKIVKISELSEELLDLVGIIDAQVILFGEVEVVVSMDYSTEEKMFTEFKVDYVDLVNALYIFNELAPNATQAFTTVTFDYYDKKYSLETEVLANKRDDYPDDLATAELVGYKLLELDVSAEGRFLDINDSDVFQFDAAGPNEYTIKLDGVESQIVQYIVSDYNGSLIAIGAFDLVYGYQADIQLAQAGTYYIIINGVDGGIYPFDYTITVE